MERLYEVRHATTVALGGLAVMIEGPSGSGKSALGLTLMALGGALVADDRTQVSWDPARNRLMTGAPPTLPHAIEARGIGLLPAALAVSTPLWRVVDLGVRETERLPPDRFIQILGHKVALLHGAGNAHLAYALVHAANVSSDQ